MATDIILYEFLQDFAFGLQPIDESGAVPTSSRTPEIERASLGFLLHSEVFLYSENHPLDNAAWR